MQESTMKSLFKQHPVPWGIFLSTLLIAGCTGQKSYQESIEKQREWLLRQQVPNEVIPLPVSSRRHLVASYELPREDPSYPFIYSKSFLYDNALAAIALCHTQNWEESQNILLALSRLIRNNGSYWFNYNLEVEWPSETDQDMALIRTGTIAWLGYAYCFYLENCPKRYRTQSEDETLLSTAEKIASFLIKTIDHNRSSPLYGLARGGKGSVHYSVSSGHDKIIERYSPEPLFWVSTEHNIDLHLFLRHLYGLTRNEKYLQEYQLIEQNMLTKLWSSAHGQFFRGLSSKEGTIDSVLSLDCASWAALFLHSTGKDSLALLCVSAIERFYRNQVNGITGYMPYTGTTIYESDTVNAFFFPDKPRTRWGDVPFSWWEGSYGAALAMLYNGQKDTACSLTKQWSAEWAQDTAGGIPYSTRTIPYQFTVWKSVASTAWHILVNSIIHGKKLPYPFFS